MIYLDNAATSWPKRHEVLQAITDFLQRAGGNPGRSGHRLSLEAGRIVYDTREALAKLFNAPDPLRVIFTANGTCAINLALTGLLRPGDHVVTSGIEHNAVMRPLRGLQTKGISITVVSCAANGMINLKDVEHAVRPSTRMIAVTHASNVIGAILPIVEIAEIAHRAGAWMLVDAAQTAGVLPIDIQSMGVDLLAFTGHKGLQGPPGTGGLVIGNLVNSAVMQPLIRGGTGSRSESEIQPEDCPDKFESGTLNGAGIAGLGAGVQWILKEGVSSIRNHEMKLSQLLMEGLGSIPGVTVYGPRDIKNRVSIVSFAIAGHRVSDIGFRLDEEYGILSRVGLHCAPAAHHTIGTFPEGTVRFAPGAETKSEEILAAIDAIKEISRKH